MEDLFLKLFENTSIFEVGLIVTLGLIFYFKLKNHVDEKLKEQKNETKFEFDRIYQELKTINQRIDKLYDTIIDLYRNLFKRDVA